jgi:hypothetical protein
MGARRMLVAGLLGLYDQGGLQLFDRPDAAHSTWSRGHMC